MQSMQKQTFTDNFFPRNNTYIKKNGLNNSTKNCIKLTWTALSDIILININVNICKNNDAVLTCKDFHIQWLLLRMYKKLTLKDD